MKDPWAGIEKQLNSERMEVLASTFQFSPLELVPIMNRAPERKPFYVDIRALSVNEDGELHINTLDYAYTAEDAAALVTIESLDEPDEDDECEVDEYESDDESMMLVRVIKFHHGYVVDASHLNITSRLELNDLLRRDITDLSGEKAEHPAKWAKVVGWAGNDEAYEVLHEAMEVELNYVDLEENVLYTMQPPGDDDEHGEDIVDPEGPDDGDGGEYAVLHG